MVVRPPSWCASGNLDATFCKQCWYPAPLQFFALGTVLPVLHRTTAWAFLRWLASRSRPVAAKQSAGPHQVGKSFAYDDRRI
jgi:hypothetical protein